MAYTANDENFVKLQIGRWMGSKFKSPLGKQIVHMVTETNCPCGYWNKFSWFGLKKKMHNPLIFPVRVFMVMFL